MNEVLGYSPNPITFCLIQDASLVWKELEYHFADKLPYFAKNNPHLTKLEYLGYGVISTADGVKQVGEEHLHFWVNKNWQLIS